MSNQKMTELLKRQESERKDLAAGVYEQWQPIGIKERELLAEYDNDYGNAPPEIQDQIRIAREDFFAEWGNEGRLTALMDSRHAMEREKVATKQAILDKIKQRGRKEGNDGGR